MTMSASELIIAAILLFNSACLYYIASSLDDVNEVLRRPYVRKP